MDIASRENHKGSREIAMQLGMLGKERKVRFSVLTEPDYSLRTTISGQSKYFLRWDTLPCVIPSYLYKGLRSRAELYDLNTSHLLSELELWWRLLLLHQNTLTQHIHQTHQLPYLPVVLTRKVKLIGPISRPLGLFIKASGKTPSAGLP